MWERRLAGSLDETWERRLESEKEPSRLTSPSCFRHSSITWTSPSCFRHSSRSLPKTTSAVRRGDALDEMWESKLGHSLDEMWERRLESEKEPKLSCRLTSPSCFRHSSITWTSPSCFRHSSRSLPKTTSAVRWGDALDEMWESKLGHSLDETWERRLESEKEPKLGCRLTSPSCFRHSSKTWRIR